MPLNSGVEVHVDQVAYQFEELRVIESISCTIEPGDFVCLLGPSGCGKSTLLRLFAGLLNPQTGNLQVKGRPGFLRSFVFQESHLMPWKTVLQNVVLPLELTGQKTTQNVERAKSILDRMGLGSALGLYPNQLSGGMKMRTSVARALVTDPDLLLLDEPFSALDEQTRFQMQEDLRDIWSKRKFTVIFVTHSIQEAVFLSNRVLKLSARPAKVLIDHKINLPEVRPFEIRLEPQFNNEIRRLVDHSS